MQSVPHHNTHQELHNSSADSTTSSNGHVAIQPNIPDDIKKQASMLSADSQQSAATLPQPYPYGGPVQHAVYRHHRLMTHDQEVKQVHLLCAKHGAVGSRQNSQHNPQSKAPPAAALMNSKHTNAIRVNPQEDNAWTATSHLRPELRQRYGRPPALKTQEAGLSGGQQGWVGYQKVMQSLSSAFTNLGLKGRQVSGDGGYYENDCDDDDDIKSTGHGPSPIKAVAMASIHQGPIKPLMPCQTHTLAGYPIDMINIPYSDEPSAHAHQHHQHMQDLVAASSSVGSVRASVGACAQHDRCAAHLNLRGKEAWGHGKPLVVQGNQTRDMHCQQGVISRDQGGDSGSTAGSTNAAADPAAIPGIRYTAFGKRRQLLGTAVEQVPAATALAQAHFPYGNALQSDVLVRRGADMPPHGSAPSGQQQSNVVRAEDANWHMAGSIASCATGQGTQQDQAFIDGQRMGRVYRASDYQTSSTAAANMLQAIRNNIDRLLRPQEGGERSNNMRMSHGACKQMPGLQQTMAPVQPGLQGQHAVDVARGARVSAAGAITQRHSPQSSIDSTACSVVKAYNNLLPLTPDIPLDAPLLLYKHTRSSILRTSRRRTARCRLTWPPPGIAKQTLVSSSYNDSN